VNQYEDAVSGYLETLDPIFPEQLVNESAASVFVEQLGRSTVRNLWQ